MECNMIQAASSADGEVRKPLRLSAPHGGRPRLLLAEDSEPVRIVTAATLKAMGCDVEAVIHGEHAVRSASEKPFDVIVLDIEMPVMDGITAARSIRRLGCADGTPLMALSAFLADSVRAGHWRDTFDIALPKPANRNELHDAVKAALAWHGEQAQHEQLNSLPLLDPEQLAVLRGGITQSIWLQLAECACRDIEVSVHQLEHPGPAGAESCISVYARKLVNIGRTFAAPRMTAAALDVQNAETEAQRRERLAKLQLAAHATVAALRG